MGDDHWPNVEVWCNARNLLVQKGRKKHRWRTLSSSLFARRLSFELCFPRWWIQCHWRQPRKRREDSLLEYCSRITSGEWVDEYLGALSYGGVVDPVGSKQLVANSSCRDRCFDAPTSSARIDQATDDPHFISKDTRENDDLVDIPNICQNCRAPQAHAEELSLVLCSSLKLCRNTWSMLCWGWWCRINETYVLSDRVAWIDHITNSIFLSSDWTPLMVPVDERSALGFSFNESVGECGLRLSSTELSLLDSFSCNRGINE